MILLPLLLACADPAPVALSTCEALPNLATDAAGLELLEPLLAPGDWEALSKAAPTAGLEKLGSEGLAALRQQTNCTLLSSESAGSGRWAVELERTNPSVDGDGNLGEAETHALSWQAVKTPEGVRIEAGIEAAAISRRNADAAVAEDDLRRAAAVWRAIHKKFPDPLLYVDIARAEAAYAKAEALKGVRAKPTGVADGKLYVELSNQAQAAVGSVELRADFAVGEQTHSSTLTHPGLEAGATVEVELAVPEGADGNVHVEVVGLELQGSAQR
jgi:hypothetical protein